MNEVLVIDDEPGIRGALRSILEDERYRVHAAEDAIQGIDMLERLPIGLVFLDVWLPRLGGMDALERIRKAWPEVEVVIISGHANIDMAVRAVKLGAFDFLEKPLSLEKVLTITRNALAMRKLRMENTGLKRAVSEDDIIGGSEAMAEVREIVDQAAGTDARILIMGENGTGKELIARDIHRKSKRSGRAFIEVNCAAIPDTLIESELFGHEKGAFTDAISGRKGRFELAHGGTLFLDEIGDMSVSAQAKVLRAIQDMKIERVGGERLIEVDVRLIAATNKDLTAAIRSGAFREDLFFRLNVIPIVMPPLRERTDDIPLLVDHFMKTFAADGTRMDDEALEFLRTYPWPGNVRELKNLVERISIMCDEERVGVDAVKGLLEKTAPANDSSSVSRGMDEPDYYALGLNDARDLFEKRYIERKLAENGYNISRTAEAIGAYPSNLHAKIKKHGIRTER